MASFMLRSVGLDPCPDSPILFVDGTQGPAAGSLSAMVLLGLRDLLGAKLDVYGEARYLYSNWTGDHRVLPDYGFGYAATLNATLMTPRLSAVEVVQRLQRRYYTAVVYGKFRGNLPLFSNVREHYPQDRILVVRGGEPHDLRPLSEFRTRSVTQFVRELNEDFFDFHPRAPQPNISAPVFRRVREQHWPEYQCRSQPETRDRQYGVPCLDAAARRIADAGTRPSMAYPVSLSYPRALALYYHKALHGRPKEHVVLEGLHGLLGGDHRRYAVADEGELMAKYAQAHFVRTRRKEGWDAMRHLEIYAAGARPSWEQHPYLMDPLTMYHHPRECFLQWNEEAQAAARAAEGNASATNASATNASATNASASNASAPNAAAANASASAAAQHGAWRFFLDHLTCDAMIRFVMRSVGFDPCAEAPVLFLDADLPREADYLANMALVGLREVMGPNVHVWREPRYMYNNWTGNHKQLYGNGFGYAYTIDAALMNRDIPNAVVRARLAAGAYKAVIYGNYERQTPFKTEVLRHMPPDRIWALHGDDHADHATNMNPFRVLRRHWKFWPQPPRLSSDGARVADRREWSRVDPSGRNGTSAAPRRWYRTVCANNTCRQISSAEDAPWGRDAGDSGGQGRARAWHEAGGRGPGDAEGRAAAWRRVRSEGRDPSETRVWPARSADDLTGRDGTARAAPLRWATAGNGTVGAATPRWRQTHLSGAADEWTAHATERRHIFKRRAAFRQGTVGLGTRTVCANNTCRQISAARPSAEDAPWGRDAGDSEGQGRDAWHEAGGRGPGDTEGRAAAWRRVRSEGRDPSETSEGQGRARAWHEAGGRGPGDTEGRTRVRSEGPDPSETSEGQGRARAWREAGGRGPGDTEGRAAAWRRVRSEGRDPSETSEGQGRARAWHEAGGRGPGDTEGRAAAWRRVLSEGRYPSETRVWPRVPAWGQGNEGGRHVFAETGVRRRAAREKEGPRRVDAQEEAERIV